jgi:ABC-type glycerol-3-phosphate transport system substrate-binding protein
MLVGFTDTPEPDPSPTSTSVPLGLKSEAIRGIDIQFWHSWTQENVQLLERLVRRFNNENSFDIEVTVESHGGDLSRDVQMAFETGEFPDIVITTTDLLLSWEDKGDFITDLSIYIQDPDWGLDRMDVDDYYPLLWEQDIIKGKRLGLPGYASSTLLAYNQTWARELGFDSPPTSTIELAEQACASTSEANDGERGGLMIDTNPSTVMSLIMAFGGDGITVNENGYRFNTLEVKRAFEYLKNLIKDGCAWIPEQPFPDDAFAARKGLFYTTTITDLPYLGEVIATSNNLDQWTAIPYPSSAGNPVITVNTLSFAVLRTSPEEQLAAWVFLSWLLQPQIQAAIVEANGSLPIRKATLSYLEEFESGFPQWSAAQKLSLFGRQNPQLGSWRVAKWAVSDAAKELIAPTFDVGEIPGLLMKLDALLAEIHLQNR